MSITQMCNPEDEGAYADLYWTRDTSRDKDELRPIYMRETHIGIVLSLGEDNGRDDSDFYAMIWNAEKQTAERYYYASTRGWTYPNHAGIDATPEVLQAYQAKREADYQAAVKARAEVERKTPSVGKAVKVVRGRKIPIGTQGEVFWIGQDSYARNYYSRNTPRLSSFGIYTVDEAVQDKRVGIKLPDGSKVFTAAKNVEVQYV